MKEFLRETNSPMVFPRSVALITVSSSGKDNIITLSWVGVVCSSPPVVAMGIRKDRFSYEMIMNSREYVINIPPASLVKEADFCGTRSGREFDKFKETGFTKEKAKVIGAPLIGECPINLECKLSKSIELGSHTLFLGEVVGTHIDENIMSDGKFDDKKFKVLGYISPHYFTVQELEGEYGFTKE